MVDRFADRRDAGRQLAAHLAHLKGADLVVLGLPRGGVPVAFEVARALEAPLDVFVVRKLGVPNHPELAMGALAQGGVRIINETLVDALGISREAIDAAVARETAELQRREHLYREGRARAKLEGKRVIVVDDGLATGATMRAAVAALLRLGVKEIIVAVPLASKSAYAALAKEVDTIRCLSRPDPFWAVGLWYDDFHQTTDEEVQRLLRESPVSAASPTHAAGEIGPGATQYEPVALALAESVQRLRGRDDDYDALLHLIGDADVVMLGEATHGTHEFYYERTRITQRLIDELHFTAVAVEADWPDAYAVNRYVRGAGGEAPIRALAGFRRFPAWMWRNREVLALLRNLQEHNFGLPSEQQVGFYGLDLYSLYTSAEAVIDYLEAVDLDAAARARERYACLSSFVADPQRYGLEATLGVTPSCEEQVTAQLHELRTRRAELLHDGLLAEDELFCAIENARVAKQAEAYYREMFLGRVSSWNHRDEHMMETLENLRAHLQRTRGRPAKVVVWAHNSHVGDARATEASLGGELSLGQLARQRYGRAAVLVGFSTYGGQVAAASTWGAPVEIKDVRPALPGSYEALMHAASVPAFYLPLRELAPELADLHNARLSRAIGVIYKPETERLSHYFETSWPQQFDALIHIDRSSPVVPLEPAPLEPSLEPPETYPTSM